MSIYLNQIRQLISLQHVDDEIHEIELELEAAPRELDELRVQFQAVSDERARQLEKMEHLHEQEKRLGIEIEDEAVRLKKSKSKLMQVGSAKEYHAMVREMDSMEQMTRDREDEKNALIEELLLQKAKQAEIEERFSTLDKECQASEANITGRLETAQAKMVKLQEQRKGAAVDVPGPVFSRYEFIRERLAHPVIVPVINGVCMGCHIAIPPQNFIELQKGTQILSCPNCQRLMFWEQHFAEQSAE